MSNTVTIQYPIIRFPFAKHIVVLWIISTLVYALPSMAFVRHLVTTKVLDAYGTWLIWCFIIGICIDMGSTVLANFIRHPYLIMPISQFQSRFGIYTRFMITLSITVATLVPIGYHFFHVVQPNWLAAVSNPSVSNWYS